MVKRAFFLGILSIPLWLSRLDAEKRVYALVPKYLNHPFWELAHQGCLKAANELGVECLFIAPSEPDETGQVRVLQDLITRRVNGIAISAANSPAIARALKLSNTTVPVITWDSDLLESDEGLRKTYVGSNNYELGVALGKELLRLKPQGGMYALQSGEAAADSTNQRMQGVRDTLGKNWKEVPGTPLFCNGDSALAVKQMGEILLKFPQLDAYVPVGAWPQSVVQAYRHVTDTQAERLKKKELIIVSGDTLQVQMDLLKEGRSHAQVGQRPFEMGARSMQILNDILEGKAVEKRIYTGLDICTQENVQNCLKS